MFYSICYDIRDDHRRNQVVKALKDYGERVQLSVFEANLRPEELSRLKERLKSVRYLRQSRRPENVSPSKGLEAIRQVVNIEYSLRGIC